MKIKQLNLIFFLFFVLIITLLLFNRYSGFSVGVPRIAKRGKGKKSGVSVVQQGSNSGVRVQQGSKSGVRVQKPSNSGVRVQQPSGDESSQTAIRAIQQGGTLDMDTLTVDLEEPSTTSKFVKLLSKCLPGSGCFRTLEVEEDNDTVRQPAQTGYNATTSQISRTASISLAQTGTDDAGGSEWNVRLPSKPGRKLGDTPSDRLEKVGQYSADGSLTWASLEKARQTDGQTREENVLTPPLSGVSLPGVTMDSDNVSWEPENKVRVKVSGKPVTKYPGRFGDASVTRTGFLQQTADFMTSTRYPEIAPSVAQQLVARHKLVKD